MIRPIFLVFSVGLFQMCSAGNPGSWSDNDNALTLNDMLKAKGWKKLVNLAEIREFKSVNGQRMDVSDLLNKGSDGNVVSPANYTVKLVKSSIVISCFFGESQNFINDTFLEIIAGRCMSMGSGDAMLDCMDRFWKTMDINKSLIEKYLGVLNFFRNASGTTAYTRILIDAFESLLPYYDRQNYIKSKYLDDSGSVNMVVFKRDYDVFLDKVKCTNKILRNFLVARCLPTSNGDNANSMIDIEEMANFMSNQSNDVLIDFYVQNILVPEKSFFAKLGFNRVQLNVENL